MNDVGKVGNYGSVVGKGIAQNTGTVDTSRGKLFANSGGATRTREDVQKDIDAKTSSKEAKLNEIGTKKTEKSEKINSVKSNCKASGGGDLDTAMAQKSIACQAEKDKMKTADDGITATIASIASVNEEVNGIQTKISDFSTKMANLANRKKQSVSPNSDSPEAIAKASEQNALIEQENASIEAEIASMQAEMDGMLQDLAEKGLISEEEKQKLSDFTEAKVEAETKAVEIIYDMLEIEQAQIDYAKAAEEYAILETEESLCREQFDIDIATLREELASMPDDKAQAGALADADTLALLDPSLNQKSGGNPILDGIFKIYNDILARFPNLADNEDDVKNGVSIRDNQGNVLWGNLKDLVATIAPSEESDLSVYSNFGGEFGMSVVSEQSRTGAVFSGLLVKAYTDNEKNPFHMDENFVNVATSERAALENRQEENLGSITKWMLDGSTDENYRAIATIILEGDKDRMREMQENFPVTYKMVEEHLKSL